jgi:hypothetical protein
MKFMATWSVPQDKWLPLCKRWASMSAEERAHAGESVKIIGRWGDPAALGWRFLSRTMLPPCSGISDGGMPTWT